MRFVNKRLTINIILFIFVAAITSILVYIKQNTVHQRLVQDIQQRAYESTVEYKNQITELTQYIASLNSRVKHLSMDNKRLSKTGSQLVAKLEDGGNKVEDKLLEINTLRDELTNLDKHIFEKYDAYIMHQNTCIDLKISCKKGSAKSKKCESYHTALEIMDNVSLQLKYLKAKRDVLVSTIERNSSTF